MTIFDVAKAVLRRTLKQQAATPFVLWRDGEQIPLNATLTKPDPNLMAITGSVTEGVEHNDLLIDPNELTLAGMSVEPRRGDLITQEKTDGSLRRWSAVHRTNEQCWRWSDGSRMFLRLYLVRIQGTAAPEPNDLTIDQLATEDAIE